MLKGGSPRCTSGSRRRARRVLRLPVSPVWQVNKSSGPFVAVFCAGRFLPESGPGELPAYISGASSAPVPTYFVDALPGGSGVVDPGGASAAPGPVEVAPNLFWLRGGGVTSVCGLRVAFLGGHFDALSFSSAGQPGAAAAARTAGELQPPDVSALAAALPPRDAPPPDLLLTCDWPRGVAAPCGGAPPGAEAAAASASAPAPIAALAAAATARYHVAGTRSCGGGSGGGAVFSFARAPFVSATRPAAVCRFLGLAPVGSPAPAKWLTALSLVPAAAAASLPVPALPADATADPFAAPPHAAQHAPHVSAADGGGGMQQPFNRWAATAVAARPKRPRPEGAGPANVAATLFVRNIPFSADEAALRAAFSPLGVDIVEVRFGQPGPDGRPKGFAHVELRTEEQAGSAIARSRETGLKLGDRELVVEHAQAPSHIAHAHAAHQPPVVAPGAPAPGCWFCLSNGKDAHLVACVGGEAYVALDKGPLTPGHALILPVEHFPSTLSLPPKPCAEVAGYARALRSLAAASGSSLLLFERHSALRSKGGNHAHVNAVPLPPAAASAAKGALVAAAAAAGFIFDSLPPPATGAGGDDAAFDEQQRRLRDALGAAGGGDAEFVAVTLPDSEALFHVLARGERVPMSLCRDAVAAALGAPQRADWRTCTLPDEAAEAAAAAAFAASFAPFDPFPAAAA